MLQLSKRKIGKSQAKVLANLQKQVNDKTLFTDKIAKAKSLWSNKGGVIGKRAFEEISVILTKMCVGVEVCNYCEGNEANDIEHIYPKTFFPEKAFEWENYILACKQCNTGYKLDKCYVLDTKGNVHGTIRGESPKFKKVALINPRIEDPLKYLWLNLSSWQFNFQDELNTSNYNKAKKTLDILELNKRDYLIAGRKSAAIECYDKLDRLCKVLKATSKDEIKACLNPYDDIIDERLSLINIKSQCAQAVKAHIQKQPHPSVWYSIKKIESKVNEKWKIIFSEIPEALTW